MEKVSLKTNSTSQLEENLLDWNLIQKNFEKSFGAEIYTSWLKNISLVKEFNDHVILGVKTRFFRDWIVSRYLDKILEQVRNFKLSINRVEFRIVEEKSTYLEGKQSLSNSVAIIKDSILNYNRLNPNFNFDNFICGQSNELAVSYSKKVCEDLNRYNPLYVYGGVGLGKTHLLNAIGLKLQNNNNVMFISAERFMYHFIKSIKKMIW